MSIAVKCRCGKKFKAKDRFAGRIVRCPNCKGPLQIPASVVGGESATAPAPTAASPGGPVRIIPLPHREQKGKGNVYENREWSLFRLSTVKLPKGQTRLTIEAVSNPGGVVMDLKGVALKRLD